MCHLRRMSISILVLHWKFITALDNPAFKITQVRLRLNFNLCLFILRALCLVGPVQDFICEIFLFIPTLHYKIFRFNRCMFCLDVSTINGTVPEEHCTFSAVSQFQIVGCPWEFIPDISDTSYRKLWAWLMLMLFVKYVQCVGKGTVRICISRRVYSGE